MNSDLRALPSGTRLSDYRLERVLGHGGFGITYLAVDLSLDQKVAIKEYYPREFAVRDSTKTIHATGNAEDRDNFSWGRDRFREEAKTLARFSHTNVVAVRRLFEANGTSYIVMDFCEGEPLDQLIKREAPLSKQKLEGLFSSLLDGLEHVHAAGVMHRDIKPANIFIRADGSPVLLDFGAARQALVSHSRSMTSLATAHYAAFEQYSTHGKQGAWTDIYGLAATLYHAATAEKPKDAPDRILEDNLEPLAQKAAGRYAPNFLRAIDAGLAVRPENRPQSIKEWRETLGFKQQAPNIISEIVEPQQGGSLSDTRNEGEKNLLRAIAGFFAFAVVVVGLVVFAAPRSSSEYEATLQNESDGQVAEASSSQIEVAVAAAQSAQNKALERAKVENCPDPSQIWDRCSGKGSYEEDGTEYAGDWRNNNWEGYGVYRYAQGDRYAGQLVGATFEGYGVFKHADGRIFQGRWMAGKMEGYGRKLDANGNVIEEGYYKSGDLQ